MTTGTDGRGLPYTGRGALLAAALVVVAAACTADRPVDEFPPVTPRDTTTTTAADAGTGTTSTTAADLVTASTTTTDGGTAPDTTVAEPAGGPFACTELLGFSQTGQWFASFAAPGWQARIQPGASVEKWIDADFGGWDAFLRSRHCSREEVDRLVFTISGSGRSTADWAMDLEALVPVIVAKYPAVRQIVLQPVVGGPAGTECRHNGETVRAYQNHPIIDAAIEQVVAAGGGLVVAGASPEVVQCSQYGDRLGHLTPTGGRVVAAAVMDWAAENP